MRVEEAEAGLGGGAHAPDAPSIGSPADEVPGCGPLAPLFDCEHFQFIDDDDGDGVSTEGTPTAPLEAPPAQSQVSTMSEAPSPLSRDAGAPSEVKKGLKSLLKKDKGSQKAPRHRVTFDESVSLYTDDHDGPRLLQLTTGPDILYTDAYYMFDPPLGFRDAPPFEPPAEYADEPKKEAPLPNGVHPVEEVPVIQEETYSEPEIQENGNSEAEQNTPEVCEITERPSSKTEPEPESGETLPPDPPKSDPIKEAEDQLFERILESDREFAVDEELDSVFRELDSEFSSDVSNSGALDDNFFRKLITLLSSAEGAPAATTGDLFLGEEEAHSRTLSEADSDCSISSQDTIIVRTGEEENESNSTSTPLPEEVEETNNVEDKSRTDPVIATVVDERPRPPPRESLVNRVDIQAKNVSIPGPRGDIGDESLSRQSSGEQSVASSQDHPQDADDSTSSDSRSGEVEEEIRLDDIGYDEEDAEDYDEESFRGMAHGNSKIRRIIKKNALQCLPGFRSIEAKRRGVTPGVRVPRPKSPLLSQESLVEKLRWLTTVEEPERPAQSGFHSKPPDVILSAGGTMNGSHHDGPTAFTHPAFYNAQRFPPPESNYYARHGSLPRPPQPRPPSTQSWQEPQTQQQRTMTVPRSFRDWRVIQRVVGRDSGSQRHPPIPADYVRCPDGRHSSGSSNPPDVSRLPQPQKQDELEKFVEQDTKRLEKLRKRYSVAEEDEDPTFGFARRPSVRGVQTRMQVNAAAQGRRLEPYPVLEEEPHYDQTARWDPNWRTGSQSQLYAPPQQPPLHIHRASVALTELPGSATIPYVHRKAHPDPRYYSYAESMYGSTRTLPTKGSWDNRTCPTPHGQPMNNHHGQPMPNHHGMMSNQCYASMSRPHTKAIQNQCHPGMPPGAYPSGISNPQNHMVMSGRSGPSLTSTPDGSLLHVPSQDERGVPEGASSSPKVSTDSLYLGPPPTGGPSQKDESMIYYSLNV